MSWVVPLAGAGALPFTAEARALVPGDSIRVNEIFTVQVRTPPGISKLILRQEGGLPITQLSGNPPIEEAGGLRWSLSIKLPTVGKRTVLVYAVRAGKITLPQDAAGQNLRFSVDVRMSKVPAVLTAYFTRIKVHINTPVDCIVLTNPYTTNIAVVNDADKRMGKILVRKSLTAEGDLAWQYSLRIGSTGVRRVFRVYAIASANRAPENGFSMRITILK